MAKKTFTVFNPTTSPLQGGNSVGAGDGEGAWFKVKTDAANPANQELEAVTFNLTGTFNSATIKIRVAPELSSPLVSNHYQIVQDDGTLADVAATAAGAYTVMLPKGWYFTLIISGSGSPIPSITATASGEIEAA